MSAYVKYRLSSILLRFIVVLLCLTATSAVPDVNAVFSRLLNATSQPPITLNGSREVWLRQSFEFLSSLGQLKASHNFSLHELDRPEVDSLVKDLSTASSDQHLDVASFLKNVKSSLDSNFSSTNHTYPLTRRLVSSFVLQKYTSNYKWTPEDIHQAVLVFSKLFQLHKRAFRSRSLIEFFHVSKSGGTSVCRLGKHNGCESEGFTKLKNCLVSNFSDGPRWTSPYFLTKQLNGRPWCAKYGWHKRGISTCERRARFLRAKGYTIHANEYVMHTESDDFRTASPCPQINTFALFREPQARLLSHMRNILEVYTRTFGGKFYLHFKPHDADHWQKLAPGVVDNYYTRSLLGHDVYVTNSSLNATHLNMAQFVLLQLDLVLILEMPVFHPLLFMMGLGWSKSLVEVHARKGTSLEVMELAKVRKLGLRGNVKQLLQANVLDEQLYSFATAVQALDTLSFGMVRLGYQYGWAEASEELAGPYCGFETTLQDKLGQQGSQGSDKT